MRLELLFTPKFYIWLKQQPCNTKSVKCLVQSAVQWLVSGTKEMYWGHLELGHIECNNLMLNLKYQSPVNREPCRQRAHQYQSLHWKNVDNMSLLECTNIDRISVDARATAMLIISTSHLTYSFTHIYNNKHAYCCFFFMLIVCSYQLLSWPWNKTHLTADSWRGSIWISLALCLVAFAFCLHSLFYWG